MLFRVLVLVLSMIMAANGQDTLASAFLSPVQKQPIHYTCTGKTIDIKINRTEVNYYAVSTSPSVKDIKEATGSNVGSCEEAIQDIPTNRLVKLTGCDTTAPLYVFVMKKPKNITSVVVGGANYNRYVINCHVPGTPNYKVNGTASLSPKPEVIENPNLKLKMTIAKAEQSDTAINIGDELTMTVSETGTFENHLAFVNCTAVETGTPKNKIDLLINKMSQEPDIITDTQKQREPADVGESVSLNFFAFRFKSSASVTITCTVEACTSTCGNVKVNPANNRRRRSDRHSTAKSKVGSVKATFEIADESTVKSGGNKVSPVATPLLAVLLTITMALFK